jgi:hypothetical protein
MNHDRPTLADLRARVHKDRHREIGNWLARRVGRPSAVYGTWLAIRLGLSAHQVTLAALVTSLAGACALGTGQRWSFVAGVFLAHLSFWLDHVDGQVARWRRTVSLGGVYLDYMMHHVTSLALGFALGFGLAARTGETRWAIAGFAIASGWTLLSLHNDCRYKAFFQRLKSARGGYRVVGGGGGGPQPPAPWQVRGWETFSWPAYKFCEIHVVLLMLTGLALTALVSPVVWFWLWGAWVVVLAIVAPSLGVARISRHVRNRAVEVEFDRWFEPLEDENHVTIQQPSSGERPSGSACVATHEASTHLMRPLWLRGTVRPPG